MTERNNVLKYRGKKLKPEDLITDLEELIKNSKSVVIGIKSEDDHGDKFEWFWSNMSNIDFVYFSRLLDSEVEKEL